MAHLGGVRCTPVCSTSFLIQTHYFDCPTVSFLEGTGSIRHHAGHGERMGGYDSETWASRIQGNRALFLCRAAATFWSGIRVAGNAAAAGRRIVLLCFRRFGAVRYGGAFCAARSEEHTSELPSLMRISYAVFCLKKKRTND